jgi:hypothetical protein
MIDPQERERNRELARRAAEWCDAAPDGIVQITCEAHGVVARFDMTGMPASVVDPDTEDRRRFFLARLAQTAALAEAGIDRGRAAARRPAGPEGALVELFDPMDWQDHRMVQDSDFRPWTIPQEVLDWWAKHRGWVQVVCRMHGEIARVDVSRDPRMLGIACDAAVIELHARWQDDWGTDRNDVDFGGMDCRTRIIPLSGSDDLLDTLQLWLALEGPWQWWTSELIPGKEPREPEPDDFEL